MSAHGNAAEIHRRTHGTWVAGYDRTSVSAYFPVSYGRICSKAPKTKFRVYATQNATQINISSFVLTFNGVLTGVQFPSAPPHAKTEQNRIVATNGLTVRFSLILQIPKFCSYYRKIVNKNSVLDNHATQNATRK